jgi:hypothetical protein
MSGDAGTFVDLQAAIATALAPQTLDEFISDVRMAYGVALDHLDFRGWPGVIAYAKERVRYCEKDPDALVMADALIDRWAAQDRRAEAV